MPAIYIDDKRLIGDSERYVVERESEQEWHYCKYCYRDVPTFRFIEGLRGPGTVISILRCCWECGSGIEQLYDSTVA